MSDSILRFGPLGAESGNIRRILALPVFQSVVESKSSRAFAKIFSYVCRSRLIDSHLLMSLIPRKVRGSVFSAGPGGTGKYLVVSHQKVCHSTSHGMNCFGCHGHSSFLLVLRSWCGWCSVNLKISKATDHSNRFSQYFFKRSPFISFIGIKPESWRK